MGQLELDEHQKVLEEEVRKHDPQYTKKFRKNVSESIAKLKTICKHVVAQLQPPSKEVCKVVRAATPTLFRGEGVRDMAHGRLGFDPAALASVATRSSEASASGCFARCIGRGPTGGIG